MNISINEIGTWLAQGSTHDEVLSRSVSSLGLSVRARKAPMKLGCSTIGDLCKMSARELQSTRNFGKKSLQEIKEKLNQLGLSLSPIDRLTGKAGDEATDAIRLIVQRWRDCTKIAGVGRKMQDKTRAVDAVSQLVADIIESSLWLSQGDDDDRDNLAKRLAKHLCGDVT